MNFSLSPFSSPCCIPLPSLLFNYSSLSPSYVPPNTHSLPSLPHVSPPSPTPSSFCNSHLSLILSSSLWLSYSHSVSHDRTTESRPAKLMTVITLRNVAAGLAFSPIALSLSLSLLLLPLVSSLSLFRSFSQGSY